MTYFTPYSSGKLKKICRNIAGNQNGQAIVELALMMGFLAMILMGLLITQELAVKNIFAIETLRYDMRVAIDDYIYGKFKPKTIRNNDYFVDIPGKMKQIIGQPSIGIDHKIEFYVGSYQGPYKSQYNNKGKLFRKIKLEN